MVGVLNYQCPSNILKLDSGQIRVDIWNVEAQIVNGSQANHQ